MDKKEEILALIEKVSNEMVAQWGKTIPKDVMETTAGTAVIYGASLYTLSRVAIALGLSAEKCYNNLKEYYEVVGEEADSNPTGKKNEQLN